MTTTPFPKLDRAYKLYEEIYDAAQVVINSETKYEASLVGIQPSQWDVLIWRKAPEAHPEIAVLAGELTHDVRSALDQLVCDLIRENGQPVHSGAQFPLINSRTWWKRLVVQRDPNGVPCVQCGKVDGRQSPLHGLTPPQIEFIGRSQPFNFEGEERRKHAFSQLAQLSKEDKHRTLMSCAVRFRTPKTVKYEPEGFYEVGEIRFDVGDELVVIDQEFGRVRRMTTKRHSIGDAVQIRITGEAELAFRVEGENPIATVQDLGRIIIAAANVIFSLSPHSPDRKIGP